MIEVLLWIVVENNLDLRERLNKIQAHVFMLLSCNKVLLNYIINRDKSQ